MVTEGATPPHPSALIENNLLAGNGWGGVDVHDAQNATVRDNVFGPMTVAGVEYPHNGSEPEAIQFSEGNRTELLNAEAYGNDLGGEAMDGCLKYTITGKLHCHDNTHAKRGVLRGLMGYLKDAIGELV